MTCGIYKIENVVNGKVYIGLSINIEKRWKTHLLEYCNPNSCEYDKILYRAIRKYGIDKFSFEIIKKCEPKKLSELEIFYIKKYNSYTHFKKSNGYNSTLGGEGIAGYVMSKEQKKIIGERSSKKVFCEGKIFDSVVECAKYYGLNKSTVGMWLCGKNKMPFKFYNMGLSYKEESNCDYVINSKSVGTKGKHVLYGNMIFNSITECSKYLNVDITTVSKWLNGENGMPDIHYNNGLRFSDYDNDKIKIALLDDEKIKKNKSKNGKNCNMQQRNIPINT